MYYTTSSQVPWPASAHHKKAKTSRESIRAHHIGGFAHVKAKTSRESIRAHHIGGFAHVKIKINYQENIWKTQPDIIENTHTHTERGPILSGKGSRSVLVRID